MRRTRLMGHEQKKKILSKSTYEGLCRKACAKPEKLEPDETIEAAYLRAIYRDVSSYLFPASPVWFQPMAGASREHIYQFHLARLVDDNRKSTFNPIEIARKCIAEASGKADD